MTLDHLDTVIAFVAILAGVSLLITVLTQAVSSLLALRGTNLRWGIQTLLSELDPQLAAHSFTISEKVLRHPLISDSTFSGSKRTMFKRWRLASAIRKDELIEILRLLANSSSPQEAGQANEPWAVTLKQSLDSLDPSVADKLLKVAPEIKKALPDDPAKADQVIASMTTVAERLPGGIHQWFDSVMDRVSQRFTVHMRSWTIIFAVLIAFALHLDAFQLLARLSTDAELRARLVAGAEALTAKADEILVSTANGSQAVYVAAMNQLIRSHTNDLRAFKQPSGFTNLTGAKAWLESELKTAGITNAQPWLQWYEAEVPQASLRFAAENLHSILNEKLKLQLIPDPYPEPFYNYWTPNWAHFAGIVASAALLSLGAPFWFNVLKSLANLRSVLAKKQQEETAAGKQ